MTWDEVASDRQPAGQTSEGQRTLATLNPQRVQLGALLRAARTAAEIETEQVATELRWYKQKVSRVESGQRVPTGAEIDRLADLYRIPHDERAGLHVIADAARKREAPARIADFAQSFVTFERTASEIRYYDSELVYGLLQTPDYARVVIAFDRMDDVEARVADRVSRRQILAGDHPPELKIVLGEGVLHRVVGGPEAHAAQLRHLLAAIEQPSTRVRILPFAVGAHRALGVGFTHLRLADQAITRVYIEGLTDATYLADPEETVVYESAHDDLWSRAFDDEESANILRRHIGN